MEYGTEICGEPCNDKFIQHVGYSESPCIKKLFSKENLKQMSCKITELLMGVDPQNRPIVVPDKTICSVLSAVYDNFRQETGDIHSRYIVPKSAPVNYNQTMIDETINVITADVKVNLGMQECNSKLSIWTTVLGSHNAHGLQRHSKIKLREKRPAPMLFNLNY